MKELKGLRKIRKKYKLSQVELAEIMGVGQSTLSKIERRELQMTVTHVLLLRKELITHTEMMEIINYYGREK